MRIVGEIPHPAFKITLMSWNNRYLIKIEQGLLEQTFKLNQFDITGEDDLTALLDEQFLAECLHRFAEMNSSFQAAMARIS
jgi:hypothetical protein